MSFSLLLHLDLELVQLRLHLGELVRLRVDDLIFVINDPVFALDRVLFLGDLLRFAVNDFVLLVERDSYLLDWPNAPLSRRFQRPQVLRR